MFKTALLGSTGKDLSQALVIIKPQRRIYVDNSGSEDIELPEGLMVAGFGKGKLKFKEQEPGANPDTHLAFEPASCERSFWATRSGQ